jgi:DNA-binding transcriptional LysR family regulator
MASLDQIEAVKDADIDAAIVYDVHHDESAQQLLDYKDIGQSDIVLALYKGHPLANAEQIRMTDLKGENFLWPFRKRQPSFADMLMRECVSHGVVPNVVQETATHSIMLSLVAVGMGIGFVEYSEQRVQSSSVVFRRVLDLNVSFKLRLFWRRSDESVALGRFLEAMSLQVQPGAHTLPAELADQPL